MANTTWRNINARCPYYRRSNTLCITCSPSDEDEREVRHRLRSDEECDEWYRAYCSRRYTQCAYFAMMELLAVEEKP